VNSERHKEQEPLQVFKESVAKLKETIWDFFYSANASLYFGIYWLPKEKCRRAFVLGALSFMSLSLVLLIVEVFLEVSEATIVDSISQVKNEWRYYILGTYSFAILVILLNQQRERRQLRSHRHLAMEAWSLQQKRLTVTSKRELYEAFIVSVLNAYHEFGATRVWLWLDVGGGALEVSDETVYPPCPDKDYVRRLERGEGVAGLVLEDGHPRYVPRLFFPFNATWIRGLSWRFPHALRFDVTPGKPEQFEVTTPKMARNQVKLLRDLIPRKLKSFVAVPVLDSSGKKSGVICIDFGRTDPLARMDVTIAASFAAMLGDEFTRRGISATA
jgi:hypothetical protein